MDDVKAQAAAQALRRIQKAQEMLHGAPGPRALARRFADILMREFAVSVFDCARVTGRGDKRTLKRRRLGIEGSTGLPDEVLTALLPLLDRGRSSELRDGASLLDLAGHQVTVVLLQDSGPGGAVMLWQQPRLMAEEDQAYCDALVRCLQHEANWLRRLDKTQAMLYKDDLTGLYNYRYLELALDGELRRADRFQGQFCLLFIDLDGFKPINDEHGHTSGSSVLRQVAEVIKEAVREVDIPIRYGGDEFVVLLLGATCSKGILAAERVRRQIEAKPFVLDGGRIARVTASIGVAAYPDHGRDRATLVRMADETMYTSKRAGKNRVTVVSRQDGANEAG